MGLEVRLPLSAAAEEQIKSWMPECYLGDNYPRAGCTVVFEIREEEQVMSVFAPTGKTLESYLVPPGMAGKFMDEWLAGKVPSKFSRPAQDRALPGRAG
jgi:hypothetical protein